MSRLSKVCAYRIQSPADFKVLVPPGFSFFEPYLQFYIREILAIGGEAYASRDSDGSVSGLFIFDNIEKTGTVFTMSREVFDYFYGLKPTGWIFSELRTEHHGEIYDIYTGALANRSLVHRFSHEISMAEEEDVEEIERFMALTHQGMNRRWVRVAFENGEKCFLARFGDEIGGGGWASIVKGVGRVHSLFVKPQLRGIGIGEDLLHARLLWLKSKNAGIAFSEIARSNSASSRIAVKGGMKVSGQVFQYYKKDLATKAGLENQ